MLNFVIKPMTGPPEHADNHGMTVFRLWVPEKASDMDRSKQTGMVAMVRISHVFRSWKISQSKNNTC